MNASIHIFARNQHQPVAQVSEASLTLILNDDDALSPWLVVPRAHIGYAERLHAELGDALTRIETGEDFARQPHPAALIRDAMALREKVARLEAQVRDLGGVPVTDTDARVESALTVINGAV